MALAAVTSEDRVLLSIEEADSCLEAACTLLHLIGEVGAGHSPLFLESLEGLLLASCYGLKEGSTAEEQVGHVIAVVRYLKEVETELSAHSRRSDGEERKEAYKALQQLLPKLS